MWYHSRYRPSNALATPLTTPAENMEAPVVIPSAPPLVYPSNAVIAIDVTGDVVGAGIPEKGDYEIAVDMTSIYEAGDVVTSL